MAKHALEVKNLTVTYPETGELTLKGVSFQLPRGKILMVVGPNGSGKSTLVKAILGLIPHTGTVEVLGQPVAKVYHEIGYLPQKLDLDRQFPLTVNELLNLTLAECHCVDGATGESGQPATLIASVLAAVGMKGAEKQLLAELSGGQLQRVLLARAIIHQPKLLILDEPESGIDVGGEQSVFDLVKKIVAERQVTAVLVSHEIGFVRRYADLVLALKNAQLGFGEPNRVLSHQNLQKLYGHE